MQIHGQDTIFKTAITPENQSQLLERYFSNLYAEGLIDRISNIEFMFFIDKNSKQTWEKQGRTSSNASSMFHVISSQKEVTIVHEGNLNEEEIAKILQANWMF